MLRIIIFTIYIFFHTKISFAKEKQNIRFPSSFYFVRHGQTSWGVKDILKGPQDLSLNNIGIEQAKKAGLFLKNLLKSTNIKIVTSTLKRANETGKEVSKLIEIPISETIDGIKERYYGDYRLVSNKKEIPPDAETPDLFKKRLLKAINNILLKYQNSTLIIVSHQKVFECLSELLSGQKKRLSQGGICYFQYKEDGNWELEILEINKIKK